MPIIPGLNRGRQEGQNLSFRQVKAGTSTWTYETLSQRKGGGASGGRLTERLLPLQTTWTVS